MAKVIGKIAAPGGTYIKDGEEKTRWINCGILLETDNGMRIKLDALPVNMGEGWLSVFPPDEKRQQTETTAPQRKAVASDPDIPF
jgi:hypothetical protein